MKKYIGITAIMLTVLVALGVTGYAYAQSATPTAEDSTTFAHRGPGGRHGLGGFELRSYLDAALAEAFGVSTDELQALHAAGQDLHDLAVEQDLSVAEFVARKQAAFASALEQAVADGVLTQAQADEIAARTAEPKPELRRSGDRPLQSYFEAAAAQAFGVTVEELQAMHAAGQDLQDLAIEQDLKMADYLERLSAIKTSALEQAVAAGALTQDQADAIAAHEGMRGIGKAFGMGEPFAPGRHAGPGGRGTCPGSALPMPEDSATTTP